MRPNTCSWFSDKFKLDHLKEIAEKQGIPAFLIDSAQEIRDGLVDRKSVGVTAGASAPEVLVEEW